MIRNASRSTRTVFTLAATIGGLSMLTSPAAALAQAAGSDRPVMSASESSAASIISRAERLLADGLVVRARAMAAELTDEGRSSALTDSERSSVVSLLSRAEKQLATLSPIEVSLQRAELSLDRGDLRAAERQAGRALQLSSIGDSERARAETVVSEVATRRAKLMPIMTDAVERAAIDFDAGRFTEAKVALESVFRSGVDLPAPVADKADVYRSKIVSIEQERGVFFGVPVASAGMIAQPETPPADQGQSSDPIVDARRQEAASLLVAADQAFADGRFQAAATQYEQVLAGWRDFLSGEQLTHVNNRISEARLKLNVTSGDPLNEEVNRRQAAKQQTLAEFNNQLAQSLAALESGDTGRARDLAVSARLSLSSGRNYFGESEFETLTKQVDERLTQIDTKQDELARAAAERRAAELARAATDAESQRQKDKETKIRENLERARALQKEMKYREALQVVDQILFLDPINPAGLILKDILQDADLYVQFHKIRDAQKQALAENAIENERAMISPAALVNYPTDWPAVSARRGEPVQFAETGEDRRVRAVLDTKRIPVAFEENTFSDVIDFVKTVSNLDIDVDWPSLEEIGITRDAPITLQLKNVTLRSVLDRVMTKVGDDGARAGWEISDGVLRIASDDLLRKNVQTIVYDIRDLLQEVPDFDEAPEFDLQSVLQSSGQGGGGGGQSPFRDNQQDQQGGGFGTRTLEERTLELVGIVQENIDPDGWVDNGGTTGRVNRLQGNLIVTNTPKNHQAIAGLLSKLREVRAMQINVESRFLLVNTEFFEQIGFDIDLYFNANNNQVRAARGFDPTVQASDFFNNDTGNLNRTVTGSGIDTDGDGSSDLFVTQGVVNPRSWSPVGVTQNSSTIASNLIPNEGFASDVRSAAPALGIAGQFLDDIQVDFLIQATQADRRSVRLTAPRLTFTNGQISNIYVATQTAFVSDLQPIVSDSAVGFDPTLATLNEGVVMLLEGTISADRRYVTLNVDVAISRLEGFQNRAVTAVAGGQLVNSADTQSFIQAPTTTVTRVQTTVTVPDQGTILIGGQRLINEVESESGVPVLSKIPILNRFFSNRIQVKEEQTLIVLIKPTILIQNEEEERNFPGLADTLRTGLGG